MEEAYADKSGNRRPRKVVESIANSCGYCSVGLNGRRVLYHVIV